MWAPRTTECGVLADIQGHAGGTLCSYKRQLLLGPLGSMEVTGADGKLPVEAPRHRAPHKYGGRVAAWTCARGTRPAESAALIAQHGLGKRAFLLSGALGKGQDSVGRREDDPSAPIALSSGDM